MRCKECPELEACYKSHNVATRRYYCPYSGNRPPEGVKMCNIFYCDRTGERTCCRSCADYDRCSNHCLNSPERCGQAVEEFTKPISAHIKAEIVE